MWREARRGKQDIGSGQNQKQEGNGIGSQDGSKENHAAEQLKAMGKISEIIGRRSATVTGETSIEVQSGNQQLHTARRMRHTRRQMVTSRGMKYPLQPKHM